MGSKFSFTKLSPVTVSPTMSLFIGNSAQYTNAVVNPEKIKVAEIQHEAMAATFNRLLRTCRDKCIPGEFGESELNTGEMCCVDRCVLKYVQANTQIGAQVQRQGFAPASMPEYARFA